MDNMTIAWNFFINKGLTQEAVSAIMGTLRAETTTVNPLLVNRGDGSDGSDSIGIIQWNSARANNLRSRPNWQTLEVQLEFAWDEMNTQDIHLRMRGTDNRGNPLGMSNHTRKGSVPLPGGFPEFCKGTDINNLARVFDAAYTRSGDTLANGKIQRRVGWAWDAFRRFAQLVEVNEINQDNPDMYNEMTDQKGDDE